MKKKQVAHKKTSQFGIRVGSNHPLFGTWEEEPNSAFVEALLAAGNNATFEGRYAEAEPLLVRALDASGKIHGEITSERSLRFWRRLA